MNKAKIESLATKFLKQHSLLSEIQDGQTLLFAWENHEVAFTVKYGELLQIPLADIIATRPSNLEQHVLYAREDEDEDEGEESEEDDSGDGGWISSIIDWIAGLFSSGTVSSSSINPEVESPRPDVPIPEGTPPHVPPLTSRPIDPTTEPAWGAGVEVTVFRW